MLKVEARRVKLLCDKLVQHMASCPYITIDLRGPNVLSPISLIPRPISAIFGARGQRRVW